MKNVKLEDKWKSPIFSIGGFRWVFSVYPNGHHNDANGYMSVVLYLAFLPPKVKSIQVEKELRVIESDTVFSSNNRYEKSKMNWAWPFKILKTENIQNFTTFTFSVKIDVCGVVDHDDNDITNQYIGTNDEESKHSAKQSDQKLIEARLDSLIISMDKLVN
eukprot:611812_1